MEFNLGKRYCYYFNEIAKIPHGSRNEKALSDYIVQFAKDHNLPYKQDEVYNVIIEKEASEGYEDAAPLILQAHIDMVPEKNRDSDHDFLKDPLDLYVEDGLLKARGTTLGADDGTGVVYMLAILEDDSLAHPKLECIFTTMEEIGLLGANALKPEDVHADRMISLDGGPEGCTLLSSAGGATVYARRKLNYEPNDKPAYRVAVKGLSGGHSGGEIHKEKGNANKLVARLVKEAQLAGADVQLVSYNGGLKDNAIPREADIVFVSSTPKEELQASLEKTAKEIATELEFSDPGFKMELEEVSCDSCLTKEDSQAILDFAFLMPDGFKHRSMVIEGLTVTSLNLGVVTTDENQIEFSSLLRSALDSGTENLIREIEVLASIMGFDVEVTAKYPGWNYSETSAMRDIYGKVMKDFGRELVVEAAHGGCECGVFKGLNPNIDIISFGPITRYIHTPDEELDLASFDRSYEILCAIIKECR